jgi:hypothetical protein
MSPFDASDFKSRSGTCGVPICVPTRTRCAFGICFASCTCTKHAIKCFFKRCASMFVPFRLHAFRHAHIKRPSRLFDSAPITFFQKVPKCGAAYGRQHPAGSARPWTGRRARNHLYTASFVSLAKLGVERFTCARETVRDRPRNGGAALGATSTGKLRFLTRHVCVKWREDTPQIK